MPRPWIWTRVLSALGLSAAFAAAAPALRSGAGDGDWRSADALIRRLVEENANLDRFDAEIRRLRQASEDLRDLQLYPRSATRMDAAADLEIDRAIERVEEGVAGLRKSSARLRQKLADGRFIAAEMLREEPHAGMIEILNRDHVDRLAELLDLQKGLQRQWEETGAALRDCWKRSGTGAFPGDARQRDAYAQALRSNLAGGVGLFYERLHAYKDSLAKRVSGAEAERVAALDARRLEERLDADPPERQIEDGERLVARFRTKLTLGMVHHYLGEMYLRADRPLEAAANYRMVGKESRFSDRARLGELRAFFSAGLDDSVWTAYRRSRNEGWKVPEAARYLALQSLYALGLDSLLEAEALRRRPEGAYREKILFSYARSLIRQNRYGEARRVLGPLAADTQVEGDLRSRAALFLAHIAFEEGYFEPALQSYRALLERPGVEDEALYGMVWCNLRLGDLSGAEFVLKKLISQHPDSPWAVEGFLVLVRKLMVRAREEWTFRRNLEESESKIAIWEEKLRERREREADKPTPETQALSSRLEAARKALATTQAMPPEDVAGLYRQALALCAFVESHYRTGEYTENEFLTERESVLGRLRRLERGRETETAKTRREALLKKLFETRSLALDIHLLHREWMEELLRFYQTSLQREIAAADTSLEGKALAKGLRRESRRLADSFSEQLAGKSQDILDLIGKLLEDPHAPARLDWLLFQKGFLLYLEEEGAYKRRLAMARWMESRNAQSALPFEAGVDPRAYESHWLELLRARPRSPYAPAALYYLGFSRQARGELDSALVQFTRLTESYPESPYAQQALIFIGEHHFLAGDLAAAEAAYDRVLEYPDSKYFDQALYKLAWTRYRASTYKSAISSFTFLLEESLRKGSRERQGQLTQEALQYTALSLAESDTLGDGGQDRAQSFGERLGDPRIAAKLLHKMAGIYMQQGRLDRARRALGTLLETYPGYERHPQAMLELASAYDKDKEYGKAADIRERMTKIYGPGRPWYAALDGIERKETDSVLVRAATDASRHYLYEAKVLDEKGGDRVARDRYYEKAIYLLDDFLRAYPEHAEATRMRYDQAEAYFAMGRFDAAARKYLEVSRAGDSRFTELAAYNAIVAAQEFMQRMKDAQPASP